VNADASWAWALVPLAGPSETRAAAFQRLRLVAPARLLQEAAGVFREAGGWASEIGSASPPHSDHTQIILAGTLAQYDRLLDAGPRALVQTIRAVLANITSPSPKVMLGPHTFDFASRVYVAGILNATPDSFYDRGAFFGLDAALTRAEVLVKEGADLIEVSGETAQEGDPIPVPIEIDRVAPVVRAIARRWRVPVAVDTYKPEVAQAALDAGAVLVNDISGMSDPHMAQVVGRGGAGLVLMHLHGRPRQHYVDLPVPSMMDWVAAFLRARTEAAVAAGVPRDHLLVDPGLNFGKHPARDLELMHRLPELRSLGLPIFVATSRKDYIRDLLHLHPDDLLEGTAAAVAFAIVQGANMLRVHDVGVMTRVARMMEFFCGYQTARAPEAGAAEEAARRGQAEH
jgi:dihydropteroate synthase